MEQIPVGVYKCMFFKYMHNYSIYQRWKILKREE